MNDIIKSKPIQLLFIVLTMAVTVTICPHASAQYQYGDGQARIVFSSSNSTQAATPPLSSNPITSNVHSNTTHSIVTPQSTSAVPEFGSIAPIILAICVIAIVVLNAKTRFFSMNHSGGT